MQSGLKLASASTSQSVPLLPLLPRFWTPFAKGESCGPSGPKSAPFTGAPIATRPSNRMPLSVAILVGCAGQVAAATVAVGTGAACAEAVAVAATASAPTQLMAVSALE